jgi:uncharacterized membrane protein
VTATVTEIIAPGHSNGPKNSTLPFLGEIVDSNSFMLGAVTGALSASVIFIVVVAFIAIRRRRTNAVHLKPSALSEATLASIVSSTTVSLYDQELASRPPRSNDAGRIQPGAPTRNQ